MDSPKEMKMSNDSAFMLSLFKKAIPEIPDDAFIFEVRETPYQFPLPEDEPVNLKTYTIPGPYPTSYEFTIAYDPTRKTVLVLVVDIEDSPGVVGYIKQYRAGFT